MLIWLKSYLSKSKKDVKLIGVDLPNTLNPQDDLEHLSRAVEILDPVFRPEVDELRKSVEPISGESPVVSSTQWGEMGKTAQNEVFSHLSRLKLRLNGLAPILVQRGGNEVFQKALECASSVEYTLETLRTMNNLFEGVSLEGDTSVREVFTATRVGKRLHDDPDMKLLLLAHNNHLQKTSVSFSGELTAVPMGQHLAHRKDYLAIGATHLGSTVPEMQFPSPDSPLGFSVEPADADEIQKDSVEQYIADISGMAAPYLVLSEDVKGAKRIRSQSASVETNVSEAFDAIFCVPGVNKDKLLNL